MQVKMNVIVAQRGDNLQELTAGKYVTHVAPDLDAITSVVLHRLQSKTWGRKAPDTVVLVPQGTPASAMSDAFGLFDIGGIFDPRTIRYDHHGVENLPRHFDGMEDGLWSAAGLVLNDEVPEFAYSTGSLADFVRLVTAADNGLRSHGAGESWERGVHALYGLWRSERLPDVEMWSRMEAIICQIFSGDGRESLEHALSVALEPYADDLIRWHGALERVRAELAEKVVYKSEDGKVWAIYQGSPLATQEAYANGAEIVVFHGANGASGVVRKGELVSPNVGQLVDAAQVAVPAIADETADWFRHPAGFMAGTSEKAGNVRPLRVNLDEIARAIDSVWQR
jgi:hypothetical protein